VWEQRKPLKQIKFATVSLLLGIRDEKFCCNHAMAPGYERHVSLWLLKMKKLYKICGFGVVTAIIMKNTIFCGGTL
jgi:hypothetical protein